MSKHYETVFILTPVLSEDQAKETAKKFKKVLTDAGAKVLHEENWGLKKLAYPIQKKSTGFYHLMEFSNDGPAVTELEIAFKRDERVMRFLTIALDKHSVAYAEKRRSKAKGETPARLERKPRREKAGA
ncbi:MAG: 30S ribosomal protein S6 [Bacteroidia bacterium]